MISRNKSINDEVGCMTVGSLFLSPDHAGYVLMSTHRPVNARYQLESKSRWESDDGERWW